MNHCVLVIYSRHHYNLSIITWLPVSWNNTSIHWWCSNRSPYFPICWYRNKTAVS